MVRRTAAAITIFFGALGAEGGQVQKQLRKQVEEPAAQLRPESFVKALEFKHSLRVCNAYPYASALSILRGKDEQLTGDSPMPYKSCRDFKAPLLTGDKLEFRVGDASAGTFSVSDLPNNDAVLLLVIHRHDTLSTAVAFESHVFANTDASQVAVIDTYKGKVKATPKIMDAPEEKPTTDKEAKKPKAVPRSEELRYDSVVAVNPGMYEVALDDADGSEKARSRLVALRHESYVVMRTGVESEQGPSYPEELVVFPDPTPESLRSAAAGRVAGAWAVAAAAVFASAFA